MKKICSKCKINKDLEDFYKHIKYKDGKRSECKSCFNAENKKYRTKYKQEYLEYGKKYYAEHKQQKLKYQKKYSVEHKQQISEHGKKYRKTNKYKSLIAKRKKAWIPILEKIYGTIACSKCGYAKCFAALDFHHRQDEVKKFSIATILKCKVMPERIKEIKKCDLLCANCHRELHNGQ